MLIKLNSLKSSEEALEKAGLDWLVHPTELISSTGKCIDSHKAICRTDTNQVLGVVGHKYVPIQNTTAFAFADTFIENFGGSFEYAGCIKGGKRVFLQARLNESFDAKRGDRVDAYITIANSFDSSVSFCCFLTPIRLICENQLNRAISHASTSVVLRHTANVELRIRDAFDVFHMSISAFNQFKQKSQYLAQKMVDRQMVNTFLDEVVGKAELSTRVKNQRERVTALFENGKGNHGQNAFELYNGLIEWVQKERTNDVEKRLDSSLFGSGALLKEKAFSVALAL